VEYVGESHTGRGLKTLQRHFQDHSGKFEDRSEYVRKSPEAFDVAVWVTSTGAREKRHGDEKALSLQAKLIERYKPTENRDDGKAYDLCPHGTTSWRCARNHLSPEKVAPEKVAPIGDADSFDFGANVNPPPKVDVPLERRADARTPDLFTGRTRLEDGGKVARRDWKGDAERLARELAECRRPPVAPAAVIKAAPPVELPEGYGATDDRGQASMFKRNPMTPAAALPILGDLVSIAYKDASGRRRTMKWGARDAPLVAYKGNRLVLVFRPVVTGRGSAQGAAEYKRMHWGQEGDGDRLDGDVLAGKAPRLGVALEITYATRKGSDGAPVNYWHTFGDLGALRRKKAFIPPIVHAEVCGGRELVRLDGGTYTIEEHGIVG
jgi:hypothetical protein